MKADRPKGMKGPVVVAVRNEEATEEITLYRGGNLGLAFRSSAHRVSKLTGQQFRSMGARMRTHSPMAQSQQGGSI